MVDANCIFDCWLLLRYSNGHKHNKQSLCGHSGEQRRPRQCVNYYDLQSSMSSIIPSRVVLLYCMAHTDCRMAKSDS